MKILFICKANVARSQIAEAVMKSITKNYSIKSAGIDPQEWEGKKLKTTIYVSPLLKEIGINVDENISKKINLEMVKWADRIIVIGVNNKLWPEYLLNSKNVEYWNIHDPIDGDIEDHRKVIFEIKERIIEFIKQIEK